MRRNAYDSSPRKPTSGTPHPFEIRWVQTYAGALPGADALVLPLVWDRTNSTPTSPKYLALGTAPDAFKVYDPLYMRCCFGTERFAVQWDSYAEKWITAWPFGLARRGTVSGTISASGGNAAGSISANDSTGGLLGTHSITIYHHGQFSSNITGSVMVFYQQAEQKWYTPAYFKT